jgi:hypothetical protein
MSLVLILIIIVNSKRVVHTGLAERTGIQLLLPFGIMETALRCSKLEGYAADVLGFPFLLS